MTYDWSHLVRQRVEQIGGNLRVLGHSFFSRDTHERSARSDSIGAKSIKLRLAQRHECTTTILFVVWEPWNSTGVQTSISWLVDGRTPACSVISRYALSLTTYRITGNISRFIHMFEQKKEKKGKFIQIGCLPVAFCFRNTYWLRIGFNEVLKLPPGVVGLEPATFGCSSLSSSESTTRSPSSTAGSSPKQPPPFFSPTASAKSCEA